MILNNTEASFFWRSTSLNMASNTRNIHFFATILSLVLSMANNSRNINYFNNTIYGVKYSSNATNIYSFKNTVHVAKYGHHCQKHLLFQPSMELNMASNTGNIYSFNSTIHGAIYSQHCLKDLFIGKVFRLAAYLIYIRFALNENLYIIETAPDIQKISAERCYGMGNDKPI